MTSQVVIGPAELSSVIKAVRSVLALLLVEVLLTHELLCPLVLARADLLVAEAPIRLVRFAKLVLVCVMEHSRGGVKAPTIDLGPSFIVVTNAETMGTVRSLATAADTTPGICKPLKDNRSLEVVEMFTFYNILHQSSLGVFCTGYIDCKWSRQLWFHLHQLLFLQQRQGRGPDQRVWQSYFPQHCLLDHLLTGPKLRPGTSADPLYFD